MDGNRVSDWLRARIVKPRIEAWMGPWVGMGYETERGLVGAVVFDSFTPFECALHVALAGPIPRPVVREVFRYPFVTVGLKRLSCSVAESNLMSLRLIEKWGFRREGCKRLGLGDENELMYGLLREECRFHG